MFVGLQVLYAQGFVDCGVIPFDLCNFDLIRFADCVLVVDLVVWWFVCLRSLMLLFLLEVCLCRDWFGFMIQFVVVVG